MKTKQLTLIMCSLNDGRQGFQVTQSQDTVEYLPGQLLDKNTVDALCRNGGWKVRIVRPQESRA